MIVLNILEMKRLKIERDITFSDGYLNNINTNNKEKCNY